MRKRKRADGTRSLDDFIQSETEEAGEREDDRKREEIEMGNEQGCVCVCV